MPLTLVHQDLNLKLKGNCMKKYNHESMEPAERDEFMEKFMDMIRKRGKGE